MSSVDIKDIDPGFPIISTVKFREYVPATTLNDVDFGGVVRFSDVATCDQLNIR